LERGRPGDDIEGRDRTPCAAGGKLDLAQLVLGLE
jgi:hypothetical protein